MAYIFSSHKGRPRTMYSHMMQNWGINASLIYGYIEPHPTLNTSILTNRNVYSQSCRKDFPPVIHKVVQSIQT